MKSVVAICTCFVLAFTLVSQTTQAQEIKPVHAEEVKPFKSKIIEVNTKKKNDAVGESKQDLRYFFGLYSYWIPGTAYTVPDYVNQREVFKVSAGTGVLPGSLRINADGTYIWNSSWDGKLIQGKWRTTGDSGYPIELLNAQEGKKWRIGKSNDEGVAIHIWDGSTWYNGKKIKGAKQ